MKLIKSRYYILGAFYGFCLLTAVVALKILHDLSWSTKFSTLSENLDYVIYGFFQMVGILILIWLLIGSGGYLYWQKQLQRASLERKPKINEIVEAFKLMLFSVLIAAIVLLVMIAFNL